LFLESQSIFTQAVLLGTILSPVYPKMTDISTLPAYGSLSLEVLVSGNCVPMRAPALTTCSLAGDLPDAFAASTFRAWLRVSLSILSLPRKGFWFTHQSLTPSTKAEAVLPLNVVLE
jgi:hypothetical protein